MHAFPSLHILMRKLPVMVVIMWLRWLFWAAIILFLRPGWIIQIMTLRTSLLSVISKYSTYSHLTFTRDGKKPIQELVSSRKNFKIIIFLIPTWILDNVGVSGIKNSELSVGSLKLNSGGHKVGNHVRILLSENIDEEIHYFIHQHCFRFPQYIFMIIEIHIRKRMKHL